jgi:phosphoglucomutase
MTVDPRAGTLPDDSDLVDVRRLLAAYQEEPAPENRVSFGTSGHRGTSLAGTFTESHVLAISEAVCRYREAQGIDGPLFLGRDTHALSEPAVETIIEVLTAHGIDVCIDAHGGATPTPVISHAILDYNRSGRGTADGIVVPPTTRPRTAASSTTRRLAGRPTPTSRAGLSARPTRCSTPASTACCACRTSTPAAPTPSTGATTCAPTCPTSPG